MNRLLGIQAGDKSKRGARDAVMLQPIFKILSAFKKSHKPHFQTDLEIAFRSLSAPSFCV